MSVLIPILLMTLTSCSFLAKNHHRNQLLKHYASEHIYGLPRQEAVGFVEKFCNKKRDQEVTKSEPNVLLGTDGFLYKGKVYHSWRKVTLKAFGLTVKKNMAPIMPCTIVEDEDKRVVMVGVSHLYAIAELKENKIKIKAKKLHPSFIEAHQMSSVKNQLKKSSYQGKMKKMVNLDASISKASRDLGYEWDLLTMIDHEARNAYVDKAYELVDKKWEERARNESN